MLSEAMWLQAGGSTPCVVLVSRAMGDLEPSCFLETNIQNKDILHATIIET